MVPTCFGPRPSSGSLQLSLAKVMLILKHSVRLHLNLLCDDVAACPSTHAIPGHAATPPHNKLRRNLTEVNLARLNCKLPDDGRRSKHVGAP